MTMSRDQVVWVYRTLLNREPESEEIIAGHMHSKESRIDLILDVVKSEEFVCLMNRAP